MELSSETLLGDAEYARRSSLRLMGPPAPPVARDKPKPRRRARKRKPDKPYSALTWQEKLALEDSERKKGLELLVSSECGRSGAVAAVAHKLPQHALFMCFKYHLRSSL